MSITAADLKKVDVQSIRDVAVALEKQSTSLNDIKNSFPNLPHVGNWTGIAATAGNDGLATLGGYMGGHADGRQAAAKKMHQAADEFQDAKDKLAKIENEASGKFSIDYATGAVTPSTNSADAKNQAAELAAGIKRAVEQGNAADADLTHAVNFADGTEKPASAPGTLPALAGPATSGDKSLRDTLFAGVGGDPASTKPAGTTPSPSDLLDAAKAKTGDLSGIPGKPTLDPKSLGGLLSVPGTEDTRQDPANRAADPRAVSAPKVDPNSPQGKAAIDKARSVLTAMNDHLPAGAQKLTPEQIEQRVQGVVANGQLDRPLSDGYEGPKPDQPHKQTGYEAFGERWDQTERGIKSLLGQDGWGKMGEAWAGVPLGIADQMNPLSQAENAVHDANDAIHNPEAFAGRKAFDIGSAAATLPWAGEGAAVRAGLPSDLLTEGGAPASVLKGWNPTGGMPWNEFEAQFGTPEARLYPTENHGFPPGYVPKSANLQPGTIIDRFGSEWGSYLAPDGTPVGGRAIAPESVGGPYNRYMITGEPLPPGWDIVEGPVQPWFGQTPSPGVPQYMIVGPEGVTPRVRDLLRMGIIDEDGPPLGR